MFLFCLFDSILSNYLNYINLSNSSLLFIKNKLLGFVYLDLTFKFNEELFSRYAYLTRPDLKEKAEKMGLFKLDDA